MRGNLPDVILQFQIVYVDWTKPGREENQPSQDDAGGRYAPTRDLSHASLRLASLLAAQSSSHKSSDRGFHSGVSNPEICSSSCFNVPWPYGQMYSTRGRPSCSIWLHEPVSTGIRNRLRHTRH